MKKILIIVLALCMVLVLAACGTQANQPTPDGQGTSDPIQSDNADELKENNQTDASMSDADTQITDLSVEEGNDLPDDTTGSKVLMAYFSCTGNTKGLAEKIASAMGADLYEIVPEKPYTNADLNYNDSSSRSTKEQNDASCRPAISGSVENMDSYDTVIIGYPIWWGQAPKILYTFMESYDFTGKTVVPFCTSASSDVGSSAANLKSSAESANWLDGTRLSSGASESDIEGWLSGLGLK